MKAVPTIYIPNLSFTTINKRLPRKQKKALKKFTTVSDAIVAEAEASLSGLGLYTEHRNELRHH